MTPTEFACICDIALKMWRTTLRGGLTDFDEYQSRVLEATLKGDGQTIGSLCRTALRDLRDERDAEAKALALLAFDTHRPSIGEALPVNLRVPFEARGGPRKNSGGPRKNSGGARPNSGGKRPGAGRPKKAAA